MVRVLVAAAAAGRQQVAQALMEREIYKSFYIHICIQAYTYICCMYIGEKDMREVLLVLCCTTKYVYTHTHTHTQLTCVVGSSGLMVVVVHTHTKTGTNVQALKRRDGRLSLYILICYIYIYILMCKGYANGLYTSLILLCIFERTNGCECAHFLQSSSTQCTKYGRRRALQINDFNRNFMSSKNQLHKHTHTLHSSAALYVYMNNLCKLLAEYCYA